jgi:hypothetical protein
MHLGRSISRRMSTAAIAVTAGLLLTLIPIERCSAAGNASLQAEIPGDPLPHGVPLNSVALDEIVAKLQAAESQAGTGATVSVAALGWSEPHSTKKSLLVTLSAVTWPGQSSSAVARQAALAAASAAATICAGAIGSPPKVDVSLPRIPHSHFIECHRASNGAVIDGLTMARDNVFVIMASSASVFSRSEFQTFGLREYRVLHTPEPSLGA